MPHSQGEPGCTGEAWRAQLDEHTKCQDVDISSPAEQAFGSFLVKKQQVIHSERLEHRASDNHTAREAPAKVSLALVFLRIGSALQCCGLCWALYKHQHVKCRRAQLRLKLMQLCN